MNGLPFRVGPCLAVGRECSYGDSPGGKADANHLFALLMDPPACAAAEVLPDAGGDWSREHMRFRLVRGTFSGLEIDASLTGGHLSLRVSVPGGAPAALVTALVMRVGPGVQMDIGGTDASSG